jgi:hypothetical protein
MWTIVKADTYVGPGFIDSGWQPTTIWVKSNDREKVQIAAYRYLKSTEVSKVRNVSLIPNQDRSTPFMFCDHRCDEHGAWID